MKLKAGLIAVAACALVLSGGRSNGAETRYVDQVVNSVVDLYDADGHLVDQVLLTYDVHVRIIEVDNPTTGGVYAPSRQPFRAEGVGLLTGDTYHATGVSRDFVQGQGDDGSEAVWMLINTFHLVGEQGGLNYMFHEVWHLTWANNREVIVFDRVQGWPGAT